MSYYVYQGSKKSRNTRGRQAAAPKKRGPKKDYIHPSKFVQAAKPVTVEKYVPTHKFTDFALEPFFHANIAKMGLTDPTPIQDKAIPAGLDGRDIVGIANTGTGKTAAFAIPVLQKLELDQNAQAIILAPTRELAQQIEQQCFAIGNQMELDHALLIGGVAMGPQLRQLRFNPRLIIGTPGRVKDHLERGTLKLDRCNIVVLDEVDRMLDMGFIEDIETIASAIPTHRQTLMFSATFDGQAGQLAKKLTRDAQRIEVNSQTEKHKNISQRLHWADTPKHKDALLDHLLADVNLQQAIVFTSTQRDAEKLAFRLEDIGHKVAALHGGMPQGKRNRTLQFLREGRVRVLIATDVAARGIDVPTISHVINYGMPMNPEDYVHRIGRTGRAGRDGFAITLAQPDDNSMIRRIERLTTQRIPNEVIAGLEPKLGTPSERPGRGPSRSFAGKSAGRKSATSFGGGAGSHQNRSNSPKQNMAYKSSERSFQAQPSTADTANHLSFGSFGGGNHSLQPSRERNYSKASENRPFASKRSGGFNSSGRTGGKNFSAKSSSRTVRGSGFVL
jgi:superfamily II DNA/RNA helicase